MELVLLPAFTLQKSPSICPVIKVREGYRLMKELAESRRDSDSRERCDVGSYKNRGVVNVYDCTGWTALAKSA